MAKIGLAFKFNGPLAPFFAANVLFSNIMPGLAVYRHRSHYVEYYHFTPSNFIIATCF